MTSLATMVKKHTDSVITPTDVTFGDYTLVIRNTSYCPFVIAWHFDKSDNTWAQGHYFNSVTEAIRYLTDMAGEMMSAIEWEALKIRLHRQASAYI